MRDRKITYWTVFRVFDMIELIHVGYAGLSEIRSKRSAWFRGQTFEIRISELVSRLRPVFSKGRSGSVRQWPPHKTACSPNRSVSHSSPEVGSD